MVLPGGIDTNAQLYVSTPPGLVDPLPSSVTVPPTFAVWLGPAFALSGPATVWNENWILEESKGTFGFTKTLNVLRLATWPLAGTGANVRVSEPGTIRTMNGLEVLAAAVTEAKDVPPLIKSAL